MNSDHLIEAMRFIMDFGKPLNSADMINKIMEMSLKMVEYGWDERYRGIFYFMDGVGYSTQ